jgi:hypothetical protein
MLLVIGLALYAAVGLADLLMRRWHGTEIAVGGFA